MTPVPSHMPQAAQSQQPSLHCDEDHDRSIPHRNLRPCSDDIVPRRGKLAERPACARHDDRQQEWLDHPQGHRTQQNSQEAPTWTHYKQQGRAGSGRQEESDAGREEQLVMWSFKSWQLSIEREG